jgi:hypothetical protein
VIRLLSLILLWFVQTKIDQYNALIGATLDRGKASQSTVTTGTLNLDAPVGGADFVTVEAQLAAAGAAGDLTVACFPYAADGVTLLGTTLPPVTGVGYAGTLVSSTSSLVQQYNVQGIDKVQFQFKNNNAATKTITASWRTENY